jgi:hypothetical protein
MSTAFLVKRVVLAVLLLNVYLTLNAQNDARQRVIPPSPNAASLGKFGDVPVNLYTGVPKVEVPLYEISLGNLKIPIGLSYHASGIKVEEEASWVGLGWTLQAGGVITRSIKGKNDFGLGGYPFSPAPDVSSQTYAQQLADGSVDSEPDIFYYNFLGRTGKFVLSGFSNGKYQVTFIDQVDLVVEYDGAGIWTITGENGIKYIFGTREYTIPYASTDQLSEDNAKTSLVSSEGVYTSWYLTEIVLVTGESIYFDYLNGQDAGRSSKSRIAVNQMIRHIYDVFGGATCQPGGLPHFSYLASRETHFDIYLNKIRFRDNVVDFITEDRIDVEPEIGSVAPQRLRRIDIRALNSSPQLVKSFEFSYGYFNSQYAGLNSFEYYRLRLDSVTEVNSDVRKNPFIFNYYKSPNFQYDLPSKDSFSRDFWGYFNGKDNENIRSSFYNAYVGRSLVPAINQGVPTSSGTTTITDSGANRDTDPELIKVGVLSTITYPTKGTTSFEYSCHDYPELVHIPGSTVSQTLFKFGPLVTNPPNYGPDKWPLDVGPNSLSLSVDVHMWCYFWMEEGTPCQNRVGDTGGIWLIHEDGTEEPFFIFNLDNANDIDYTVTDYKHFDISLPEGKYEVRAEIVYDGWYAQIDLGYSLPSTQTQLIKKPVGGLRATKVVDDSKYEAGKKVTKMYLYEPPNSPGTSSGVLMNQQLTFHYTELYYAFCSSQQQAGAYYITRRSWSNVPLGTGAQGSHIGYTNVTELSDENGAEGKTEYSFMNYPEDIDPNTPIPDETTIVPLSNGQILTQTDYRKDDLGIFRRVRFIENAYLDKPQIGKIVPCIKAYITSNQGGNGLSGNYLSVAKYYPVFSEKWNLIKKTETDFESGNENIGIAMETEYFYDNDVHLQLTRTVETFNSRKLTTKYIYPSDIADADADPVTLQMKGTKHIHNALIQKIVMQERSGIQTILKSEINKFGDNFLIQEVAATETTVPIANDESSFPSYKPVNGYNTTLFKRLHYYSHYDEKGNLLQYQLRQERPQAYIYGYHFSYPVAEVRNATYDEVIGVLGQSTLDGLNNTTYSDDQVRQILNTLRSAPSMKKAFVSTFTYRPLVGMTSATDANNVSSYFEFDGLGRLTAIRDQNKAIVKSLRYHYKGATD